MPILGVVVSAQIVSAELSHVDEMRALDAEVEDQPRSAEWYRSHVERQRCIIALSAPGVAPEIWTSGITILAA